MSGTKRTSWPWGLEDNWTDLGADVLVRPYTTAESTDDAGLIETHLDGTGEWCGGQVPFRGHGTLPDGPEWDVISSDPLTLSPSVLCRTCGHHGWIRDGKWVPS